jgi:CPA2 family monovalent cation:H+ antiporter-2
MRDAFAVLFFVSVGMLFNPATLLAAPWKLLAVLAIVIVGKALAGFLIVVLLRGPLRTGLAVAAGLAQVGEFSFIVAELGRQLRLLPEEGYQLILAAALLSIALNPALFQVLGPAEAWLRRHPRLRALVEREPRDAAPVTTGREPLRDHAVVVGYGRVGQLICRLLEQQGVPYVVIEQNHRQVMELRRKGRDAYFGDGGNVELLAHVHLDTARVLVLAAPDPLATRRAVDYAHQANPDLHIIARTHSQGEWLYLHDRVADVVLGERVAALEMARSTLQYFGATPGETEDILAGLRSDAELGLAPAASPVEAREEARPRAPA